MNYQAQTVPNVPWRQFRVVAWLSLISLAAILTTFPIADLARFRTENESSRNAIAARTVNVPEGIALDRGTQDNGSLFADINAAADVGETGRIAQAGGQRTPPSSLAPPRTREAKYPDAPPAVPPKAAAKNTNWPMHRGDPQLQGRVTEAAPKEAVLRWKYQAGKAVKGGAAIVDGRVYFGDDMGTVHCVTLATGKKDWSFETGAGIEATPLVLDDMLYVGALNGKLYAINAVTGEKKWEKETGDKIIASASWAKDPASNAKWVLVGSYDFLLYAYDAVSGKELWKIETENFINSTPAITSDGLALFGGCDALVHVISLKEQKEVRKLDAEAYVGGSAAVDGTLAYFGSDAKKVYAFDTSNGNQLWTYRDRSFGYFSSPALSPEFVIIGGRDKRLHCLNRKTGDVKWTFATKGDVDSSPVLCSDGGIIFGSLDGRLYCVELATGKQRWSYEIGAEIPGSAAVGNGAIVIGAADGNVYCFGTK